MLHFQDAVALQADGLSVVCAVTTTAEAPPPVGERLGQHSYGSGVELTLDAVPSEGGWALTISDTGCWVIAADGRAVRHHARRRWIGARRRST